MRFAVPIIFLLSGVTGLVYEITWMRLFAVVFGNSTHAVSVVLAVFMTGLALGAVLVGPLADRSTFPLALYGLVEIGIGASALLVPTLLGLTEPWIAQLYESGPPPLSTLTTVRILIAFGVMLVPTALMGATLPIVSKVWIHRSRQIGRGVALLYGINTLGAIIGCLLTGFFLIRWLGVTNSAWLAAAVNIGLGILVVSGRHHLIRESPANRSRASQAPVQLRAVPATRVPPSRPLGMAVFIALFVSGFSALSLEVIWSRTLGFVFQTGMSVYAFTVVLSVFLAAISLGGLIYRLWHDRILNEAGFLGTILIAVGATAVGSMFLFGRWNSPTFLEPSQRLWVNDFLKAAFLISAPGILMGISFPAACRLVAQNRRTLGGTLGRAYGINTLGCVLGPLAAGFLLIPGIGSAGALKVIVTANIVTGVGLWIFARTRRRGRLAWAAAILAATTALDVKATDLLVNLFNTRQQDVVYFWEGASSSVMAVQQRDGIDLIVGGSVGAGSSPRFQRTDEMLAYVPILLHPDPSAVAVVGFGTGRTAGLYAAHPSVDRVDVIEIVRGTLDAGRDVFATFNRRVLSSPKVTTVIDDGFNFMKYGTDRYDVISLDPYTPRDPGSARLYTLEFLRSVRDRLNEGGMVISWAYPGSVRTTSFRVALKTFHAVFPRTTVWTSPVDQMLLFVGSHEPLVPDSAEVAARLATRPEQDGYKYHVKDAEEFWSQLLADETAVSRIVAQENNAVFTVDRPNLEYIYLSDRSPFWRR